MSSLVYKSNGGNTTANTVVNAKVEKVVAIYMKKKTINYIKNKINWYDNDWFII